MNGNSRKKILYIITKSVWGGAGRYVYDLATNLPQTKFEPMVAAGGAGHLAQKISAVGGSASGGKEAKIDYYDIKNFQRNVNVFKEFLASFEILRLLLKIRPDVVHVNSSKAGGIVGIAALIYKLLIFNFKLLTVFTAHGWAFHEERPKWQIFLIKFFSRLTALLYDEIICVSEFDRQSAIKNKIAPAKKLITIRNGIKTNTINFIERNEAQKKLINKTSPFVIGTIAEWTKNKGLFSLLSALIKIDKSNFEVILIGSGENEDKKEINEFVKKHNLKNVHLLEWVPSAATHLKAFDVFILPSLKEGLPYVLLEAGLAELPVITTPVGGIPEIINDPSTSSGQASGLFIKPGDSESLKKAIEELIASPDLAKSLASNLRQKILVDFNFQKMLDSTIAIYEK